jgi:hypothetical protein
MPTGRSEHIGAAAPRGFPVGRGMIQKTSLDGTWEFAHVEGGGAPDWTKARPIQVPGPWQAQFPDLRMKAGVGWHRRTIHLAEGFDAQPARFAMRLCFGAVFHNAAVWVNGEPVGQNFGGFLPFAFEVGPLLRPGPNEILVRAESPTDDPRAFPDGALSEIPYGKQNWYGPQSGIWQSVHLERRDHDHVQRLELRPDLRSGNVEVAVHLARPTREPLELELWIRDAEGRLVASLLEVAAPAQQQIQLGMHVEHARPWSPDSPHLYELAVAVRRRDEMVDEARERFGFRLFEARDGRFYLNGEHVYLRAALDQDYYPDTICTTPSTEFLEDQFRKAKQLGLNCLRCHVKVPDPRYYEVADRIGMLVWTEVPHTGRSTEASRARLEATLQGILERDGNHPSIVCWTLINENWGTDLVNNEEHRAWLKRRFAWLKQRDPGRLVVDNSPLSPSLHVQSDTADFHFYASIPDHRGDWDRFIADFAAHPAWLYSQAGDAERTGAEPLVCSEFGNWGLPEIERIANADGSEPWWFETGHDWSEGVMYAHGVRNRFSDWSLERVFGSLSGFAQAAQWQQFRALKYQIESMRRQPQLAGYVITELTDCHWESNGLLDMRRNPRAFHNLFHTINADTVIAPRWERLSYWGGETASLEVSVAHGGARPLEGARLEVMLGDGRSLPMPPLAPGQVAHLGRLELPVPLESTSRGHRVQFELRAADGSILATNHLDLAVHRGRPGTVRAVRSVWSPDPALRERLEQLGYLVAPTLDAASVIVAEGHDPAIAAAVRHGGRLLLLPTAEGPLYPFFPHWQNVQVRSRTGTVWRGDWASSFAWLDRSGLFQALPGGPLIDESFDRVIPEHVIAGCNLLDFQARVHAGLVVGWIHKPVALAVEQPYGRGHLVASTFRLFRDAPGADPTATVLLDSLIALAVGAGERLGTATELEPA